MVDLVSRSVAQAPIVCGTQFAASRGTNAVFGVSTGTNAAFFTPRPLWSVVQRWLLGTVLASLAVRMATEAHR